MAASFPAIFRSREGYEKLEAFYDRLLGQWPVPYEIWRVPTRHGEAYVIVSGAPAAPPLVLLHGASIHSGMWVTNIEALSQQYRTYCIDIIGEGGRSAPTRLPRKGPEHAAWVCEVLDGLGIKSTPMVGMSLGGWLALHTAGYAPDQITGVIAMAPPGFTRFRLGFLLRGIRLMITPTRDAMHNFIRRMTPPTAEVDPKMVDAMLLFFKHVKPNSEQPQVIPDAVLRRITCPTLVMVGQYEVINKPQDVVNRALRLIPNVQAEIIPNTGHGVSSDQPAVINKQILEFLAQSIG